MNFNLIAEPEAPGHHAPPSPPCLAGRGARREYRFTVGDHWCQLGGAPRLNSRERLPAARAAFNQAVPDRPTWLGVTHAPARWRSANVLIADIAAEIATGSGHELYGRQHLELEVSLISLFAERRAGRRRRRRLCDCLLAAGAEG